MTPTHTAPAMGFIAPLSLGFPGPQFRSKSPAALRYSSMTPVTPLGPMAKLRGVRVPGTATPMKDMQRPVGVPVPAVDGQKPTKDEPMSATPPPIQARMASDDSDKATPRATTQLDGESEVLKDRALAAIGDVSKRPGFYGKLGGYAAGGIIAITVLKAVVGAVDSLPVLPSFLELVGLGYCAWFAWRYVVFKSSREELMEEVDDLLGRTTGRRDDSI